MMEANAVNAANAANGYPEHDGEGAGVAAGAVVDAAGAAGAAETTLEGALEALLFVTDEPIGVMTFAEVLDAPVAQVEAALHALAGAYAARGAGIALREVAGGWRLFTAPAYHDLISRYVMSWDTRRLTQASLETLAIVAYNQPITRAGISSIRGVNSDSSLNGLVEKGLVREAGTADAPGNPMTYVTGRVFLERFGLKSVDELPDVTEFAPDEATKALIRQRLGGDEAGADASDASALPDTLPVDDVAQARALQTIFGVVDKIDFDKLVFESDDDD